MNNFAVLSCLKASGVFDGFAQEAGLSVDNLLQQWEAGSYIPVEVTQYISGHHFGPTLQIKGPEALIELCVPWSAIVGVLIDHSGKTKHLGFAKPS
jgi:hypothetical protein